MAAHELKRGALSEAFRQAWGQALLAVSAAEEEAAKVSTRLGALAGFGPEEGARWVRELSDRLVRQRQVLERTVEEGVKRTVERLRLPRREQVEELHRRLNRLTETVQRLEGSGR